MSRCLTAILLSLLAFSPAALAVSFRLEGKGVRAHLEDPALRLAAQRVTANPGEDSYEFRDVSGRYDTKEGQITFTSGSARFVRGGDGDGLLLSEGVRCTLAPPRNSQIGSSEIETEEATVYRQRIAGRGGVLLKTEGGFALTARSSSFTASEDEGVVLRGEVVAEYVQGETRVNVTAPVLRVRQRENAADIEFPEGFLAKDATYTFRGGSGNLVIALDTEGGKREPKPAALQAGGVEIRGEDFSLLADTFRSTDMGPGGHWDAAGNVRFARKGLSLTAQTLALERPAGGKLHLSARPTEGGFVEITLTDPQGLGAWSLRTPSQMVIEKEGGDAGTTVSGERSFKMASGDVEGRFTGGRWLVSFADKDQVAFDASEGRLEFERGGRLYNVTFDRLNADMTSGSITNVNITGIREPCSLVMPASDGRLTVSADLMTLDDKRFAASGGPVRVESPAGRLSCRELAVAGTEAEEVLIEAKGSVRLEQGAKGVSLESGWLRGRLTKERRLKSGEAGGGALKFSGRDFSMFGERVVKSEGERYTIHGKPVLMERQGKAVTVVGTKVEYEADTGRIVPEGGEIRVE